MAQPPLRLAERRPSVHPPLTPSETSVLALIATGLTGPEIAQRLNVSPNTVATHAQHVRQKLGTRTQAGAVAIAISRGIIELAPLNDAEGTAGARWRARRYADRDLRGVNGDPREWRERNPV